MSYFQTVVFAIVQAITELFPVSSVAHGVLTPFILGWTLTPAFLKDHFLPFLVALHLGTAVALLLFFRKDWLGIIRSMFSWHDPRTVKLLVLVIAGTIPAGIIGVVLEKQFRHLFGDQIGPLVTAVFLIFNGIVLWTGEAARGRGTKQIEDLKIRHALLIGLAQSLALIPGFSRSGLSIVAGFWTGLTHEASARFSMLLATPLILGASVLEIPRMMHTADPDVFQKAILGGVLSGVIAYLTVWALMAWFRQNEIKAMRPFAVYCGAVGVIVLAMFFLQ